MKKMINIFAGSFDFKQTKKRRKFFARLIQVELLVVVFLLASCSSGGGNGGSNIISSVTYTPSVSAGPGVIATQAVDVTKNATIIIQSSGNALNGTTIYIPANTLGTSGTNTISIGYTDTLPGPLNPDAVAAGVTVVSKTIGLTQTNTTPFASIVQVTVPYNTTLLSQTGIPIVDYWDPILGQYEAAQVVGLDRAAGTITFNTKHFTSFVVSTFNNALITTGTISVPIAGNGVVGGALVGLNGGFAPSLDGFAVNNFTTQSVDVSLATLGAGGLCYGMTSFAAFYFNKLENQIVVSPSQRLYNYYFGEMSPYMSNPIEQDIARELIFDTYILTYEDNVNVTSLPVTPGNSSYMAPNVVDSMTANTLLQTLQKENTPQLLTLYQIRNWNNYGFAHSVLVYGYSPPFNGSTLGNFLIYDPTWPNTNNVITYDTMRQKFQPYIWPSQQASFPNSEVYSSPTVTYTLFTFDAIATHFSTTTLQNILTSAQSGWPDKYFKTIPTLTTIAYVDGQAASDYPDNTYAVDPSRNIVVNGSVQSDATDTTSGAYFYINGGYIGYAPITNGRFNSDNLVLYGSPTLSIPSGTCSAELVTIVSAATGSLADGSQEWGIPTGYTGFLRETVLLPLCGRYTGVAYSFDASTPQNATPAQGTPLPSPLGFRDDFETITFDGMGSYTYTKTRNTDGTLSTSSGAGTYVIAADGTFTTSEGHTGSVLADGSTIVLMTQSGNPQIGVGIINSGIFNNASLTGGYAYVEYSFNASTPQSATPAQGIPLPSPLGFSADFGTITFDGAGVYTYTMTQNTDGTLSTVSSFGTYSVAADGTFTTSEGFTGSVLANGSTFVRVTQSGNTHIGVGINNGGSFSNASLTGDYACVAYSFNESAPQNATPAQGTPLPSPLGFRDDFDTITFDGVGGYTYTRARNTDGTLSTASKSGTYSVAADGTFTTSEGQIGNVIADGSTFVFMTENGNPQIGVGVRW